MIGQRTNICLRVKDPHPTHQMDIMRLVKPPNVAQGFGGFPGRDQHVTAREHALRGLRLKIAILYISHDS